MTKQYSIDLTKTITVVIQAESADEAIDEAVNNDDINNGEWERAEHKAKVRFEYLEENQRIIELAEFYDNY